MPPTEILRARSAESAGARAATAARLDEATVRAANCEVDAAEASAASKQAMASLALLRGEAAAAELAARRVGGMQRVVSS